MQFRVYILSTRASCEAEIIGAMYGEETKAQHYAIDAVRELSIPELAQTVTWWSRRGIGSICSTWSGGSGRTRVASKTHAQLNAAYEYMKAIVLPFGRARVVL